MRAEHRSVVMRRTAHCNKVIETSRHVCRTISGVPAEASGKCITGVRATHRRRAVAYRKLAVAYRTSAPRGRSNKKRRAESPPLHYWRLSSRQVRERSRRRGVARGVGRLHRVRVRRAFRSAEGADVAGDESVVGVARKSEYHMRYQFPLRCLSRKARFLLGFR